jgi:hypothetical protein
MRRWSFLNPRFASSHLATRKGRQPCDYALYCSLRFFFFAPLRLCAFALKFRSTFRAFFNLFVKKEDQL